MFHLQRHGDQHAGAGACLLHAHDARLRALIVKLRAVPWLHAERGGGISARARSPGEIVVGAPGTVHAEHVIAFQAVKMHVGKEGDPDRVFPQLVDDCIEGRVWLLLIFGRKQHASAALVRHFRHDVDVFLEHLNRGLRLQAQVVAQGADIAVIQDKEIECGDDGHGHDGQQHKKQRIAAEYGGTAGFLFQEGDSSFAGCDRKIESARLFVQKT